MFSLLRFARTGRLRPRWWALVGDVPLMLLVGAALLVAVLVRYYPFGGRCKDVWASTQVIQQAIGAYQADNNGVCPWSLEQLVIGKYLTRFPADPWGTAFRFRCPGDHFTDGADVWSAGRNRQFGDEDDVLGWRKVEETCKPRYPLTTAATRP